MKSSVTKPAAAVEQCQVKSRKLHLTALTKETYFINLSALIGGKFICKKNHLQDLLSRLNAVISTNERT